MVTGTQFVVTDLNPDTWYEFRVASESDNVVGLQSPTVAGQTLMPVPNPPTNLQVKALQGDQKTAKIPILLGAN
jgi:hypothetical protein